jgi:hypothetical protein
MLFRQRSTQLPARKLKRGMAVVFNDDTAVQVLAAYPAMDVDGAPIWLELANGDSGGVDANEVFTVLR